MQRMINAPNMVLIGSAGRNSGKTVFACRVINDLVSRTHVVGLKVSTVHQANGRCLRGGDGCGVCTSIGDEYCVTIEKDDSTEKDTARMLAAGAHEVYWLRSRKRHLAAGMESILSAIPPGSAVVCESNSLREVLEPGVFLMMRQKNSTDLKSSAAAVMGMADRIVTFDGSEFDLDRNDLIYTADRFCLKFDATLILLAGGESSRMGTPKTLLPYEGVPLIRYIHNRLSPLFVETIVSANEDIPVELPNVRYVADRIPGFGPVGGIISALENSRTQSAFVTACDIPTIHIDLISELIRAGESYDVVVPRNAAGSLEPLHAVYNRSVIPEIERLISRGERRIRMIYDSVATRYVDLGPDQDLKNVNTPEEYRRISGLAL